MKKKYRVTLFITRQYERTVDIHARDEAEAENRACEIARRWDGVKDALATDSEPMD